MDALKVAAIGRTGRGDWGHQIDEIWADVPGAKLVAVADETDAGLTAAVTRSRLEPAAGFRDWRKMLAAVQPDVVAICMREIDCHADMAIAAARAGAKGVFMEKPFVPTAADGDRVIAACTEAGTKLCLAFVNRHAATFAAIRDLIEDGRIGKVLEFRGRGKEDKRGGGQDLWVLGCHVLDLMTALGGAAQWCEASVTRGGRPITRADAAEGPEGIGLIAGDAVVATFGLADGAIGSFASVREAGLKQPNFGLTVVGTAGAIHIRPDQLPHAYLREAPLWRVDEEFPWLPIGPAGLGDGAVATTPEERLAARMGWGRRAAADLVEAIIEDREPETGMYAGLATVEMTAAVFKAAIDGRRVSLPLEPRTNPLAAT